MDEKRLIGLLPLITASLVDRLADMYHISEDDAIRSLYGSKLYEMLEQEKTKVWQFSTEKLVELYEEEQETGSIDFPEY